MLWGSAVPAFDLAALCRSPKGHLWQLGVRPERSIGKGHLLGLFQHLFGSKLIIMAGCASKFVGALG